MGPNPARGGSGSIRRLHLVEYSAEQGGFVLATRRGAKTGSYVLAVDEALVEQLDRARRMGGAPPDPAPGPASRSGVRSGLTPREIQARLRAGQSLDEVANEAGVGLDWIERFAGPVLAEQAAAIERAGAAHMQGDDRRPRSDRPLEAAVRRNLAQRGVTMPETDFRSSWSAHHVVDTDWYVAFRFGSRSREVVAEWNLDLATGVLQARNRNGAELGFVMPEALGDESVAPSAGASGDGPRRRAGRPRVPARVAFAPDDSQPELPLPDPGPVDRGAVGGGSPEPV